MTVYEVLKKEVDRIDKSNTKFQDKSDRARSKGWIWDSREKKWRRMYDSEKKREKELQAEREAKSVDEGKSK